LKIRLLKNKLTIVFKIFKRALINCHWKRNEFRYIGSVWVQVFFFSDSGAKKKRLYNCILLKAHSSSHSMLATMDTFFFPLLGLMEADFLYFKQNSNSVAPPKKVRFEPGSNRFSPITHSLNLDPDLRFSSAISLNLGSNLGLVQVGSEPNSGITS
jgi:hypothetical protein